MPVLRKFSSLPRSTSLDVSSEVQRKLTTILAADAEGYSRAMDMDEVRTLDALALGTLIALKAALLFKRGWFKLLYARGVVIVCVLALVNLFTWSGYPWVMWPAAALITIELIR